LIWRPVVDTNHKVPFVVSVSNSYPYGFDLLMALAGLLGVILPSRDLVSLPFGLRLNTSMENTPSLTVRQQKTISIPCLTRLLLQEQFP